MSFTVTSDVRQTVVRSSVVIIVLSSAGDAFPGGGNGVGAGRVVEAASTVKIPPISEVILDQICPSGSSR